MNLGFWVRSGPRNGQSRQKGGGVSLRLERGMGNLITEQNSNRHHLEVGLCLVPCGAGVSGTQGRRLVVPVRGSMLLRFMWIAFFLEGQKYTRKVFSAQKTKTKCLHRPKTRFGVYPNCLLLREIREKCVYTKERSRCLRGTWSHSIGV